MEKLQARFLIVLITVFLVGANVVLGVVLAEQSKKSMKTMIDSRMLDIANSAADFLNGDELRALKAEDKGKRAYQKINDTLAVFQDNIDLKYIYCVRDIGNKQFVFTVDPTLDDPGEFGEPIVFTEALYQASLGTATADREPYSDRWGRFYSAYSPVFDSSGNVVGIVAVDFSADWYEAQIAEQRKSIILCIAFSVLMCVSLGWVVARRTTALESALQDVKRMRFARDRYKIYAKTDQLTKLLNKAATERISAEYLADTDPKRQAAVYVIDLDHFKVLNDTYGHSFGDKVLVSFAERLRYTFGSDAVIGRFGGDEFVVLSADSSARETAERKAMELLRGMLDMEIEGTNLKSSVSIGIAITPQDGASYGELFQTADNALYRVKTNGRNGYSIGRDGAVNHGVSREC